MYKEDWEADKSLIYFPAHITPGYEAAVEANKATSDVRSYCLIKLISEHWLWIYRQAVYKKNYEDTKGNNEFNVADTQQYKHNQDIKDLTSDVWKVFTYFS